MQQPRSIHAAQVPFTLETQYQQTFIILNGRDDQRRSPVLTL